MTDGKTTDTRLEGVATHELVGELVRRAKRGAASEAWRLRTGEAVSAAARAWGLSAGDLFRATRRLPVPYARWTAFVLLGRAGMTRAEIADLFGQSRGAVECGRKRIFAMVARNVATAEKLRGAIRYVEGSDGVPPSFEEAEHDGMNLETTALRRHSPR